MVEEQKKEETEQVKPADAAAAFSSSINELRYSYDIFLSFRGIDTRHTFTGYLYDALCQRGFNTFIDDEGLERGEQISLSLLKAIEESKVSIVVFSENYAFSPWCLDELVKILECKKKRGQKVWPIFYKVEPSDVRHQKNSYEEAMAKHEDRCESEMEKVKRWRSTLKEIANLSGWTFKTGYEYKFIIDIIEEVSNKLHRQRLYIGEHIVGLKSHLEEMKSILDIGYRNTITMVGIHGTGGMGKSTLAKVLYNLIVDQFDNACFLEFVRERSNSCMGLVNLQEALLSQIFGKKNFNLRNVDEGANIIKHRLCNRRVLLVLDDIDKEEQLEKLAGAYDWFGPGSRIIITTRDMHILRAHLVDKTYEMKKLNNDQALELFCWKAFKRNHPDVSFVDISNRIVHYAKGLPLALKVIGSNLFGRSLEQCKSALDQYERIPNKDIQGVLRVSYDSLECNQRAIFLDIACFFKGERLKYVEQILDACDLSANYGIQVLVDKSLIAVDQVGTLQMHDLIQQMGREVVRDEAPSKLGKRSRLWYHEDILRVLIENSGTDNIEGIMLDLPQREEIQWSGTAFEKMNNLRILIVRNACFSTGPKHLPNNLRLLDWEEYPSKFLPEGFYTRKVVILKLCSNHLRWMNPFLECEKLTCMDFSGSQQLTLIPDMAGAPNLTTLRLVGCTNLKEVHDSVGGLTKLLDLNLEKCTNLEIFPHGIRMTSLRSFNLRNCGSLQHFPDILEHMVHLVYIDADGTGIKQIPHSICYLPELRIFNLSVCYDLVSLPESIYQLDSLKDLNLYHCKKLAKIARVPPNLRFIRADGCISLTSESSNTLWSQAQHEMNFCQVFMPRTQIPNWFDHRCKGASLSFWVRRKFPDFAFAIVFGTSTKKILFEFDRVEILGYNDGCETLSACYSVGDGTLLCYMYVSVTNFNTHDWNHFEIKSRMIEGNSEIDECGVYIYKQDTNMEDIQFECPIPHNSNMDTVMSREDEEVRDKIEEAKPRKRSHSEFMSRNDENIHEVKARKKSCRVMSRNGKHLEAHKLPRRFIKKSARKRIGINTGWRRQALPPFFSKFFKLSSPFHSICKLKQLP